MITKTERSVTLKPYTGFVQLGKLMKPIKTGDMQILGRQAFINFPLCNAVIVKQHTTNE